jgi:DNA-binding protein HU-beta
MNREDMVNAMVRKTGFMRKDAEAALEAVFQIITEALSNGDRVQVTGFGTFEVKNRAPRVGRNPRANTPVQIPARKSPSFKAGKALKEAVGAPR